MWLQYIVMLINCVRMYMYTVEYIITFIKSRILHKLLTFLYVEDNVGLHLNKECSYIGNI